MRLRSRSGTFTTLVSLVLAKAPSQGKEETSPEFSNQGRYVLEDNFSVEALPGRSASDPSVLGHSAFGAPAVAPDRALARLRWST